MQCIAVIGGGAAGASVVGEFLRHARDLEVVWLIGHHAEPGRGVAYATQNGAHLLNVRAANMGLFADDPGGFYRYLERRGITALPSDFVPRAWFGDYIQDTLDDLMTSAPASVRVRIVSKEVTAMEQRPLGYLIRCDDDALVMVDGVVLAVGALPPVPIAQVEAAAIKDGNYWPDPWHAVLPDSSPQRVVVLGSGLTAVDVILSAAEAWPDAQLVALSRHGRLPSVHSKMPSVSCGQLQGLIDALRAKPSVRAWTRLVREAISEDCEGWRSLVDGLRPVAVELWRSLDATQRRRFLRHLRWAWEVVRHRMPPQTADAIDSLRAAGRLEIVAGRVRHVGADRKIVYRQRDDGTVKTVTADLVIQATGLQTAAARTRHRLVQQMLDIGLAKVDAHGLGIEADIHGRVVAADGSTSTNLRVIGTLLRGALWECSALPEIRMFAARLARELLADILSRNATDDAVPARKEPQRRASGRPTMQAR